MAEIVSLFTVFVLLHPLPAIGFTLEEPDAIIITTDNQKYDFVVRPTMYLVMPGQAKSALPEGEKVGEVLEPNRFYPSHRAAAYPASGLYPHGSMVPLWTVDWHEVNVVVSEDGHHLARLAWSRGSDLNHPAIMFYEDGKEIRSWSMRELVRNNPLCLIQEGWYFGMGQTGHSGNVLRISNGREQTVVFNMTTGEMLERTMSKCSLEFPRIPSLGLWSSATEDPLERIEQDEDHQTNYGVLLSIALGIVIILLQTKKAHKKRNRTDD